MRAEIDKTQAFTGFGWGERIVVFIGTVFSVCLGLVGFGEDGETGFWYGLACGVVVFMVLHAIFNAQLKAFYARMKPTKYDGVVEDALNVASHLLRE